MKLNKKIEKIHKKVFELLKLSMLTKLDYKYLTEKRAKILNNVSIQSEIYPNIDEKIDELFALINKYFEGVVTIDDDQEKKIIEENLLKYEITTINDSVLKSEWAVVNVLKNKSE